MLLVNSDNMNVVNLHAVGDLRYETAPIPQCSENEVLVKVMACGICGSDIGRVYKNGTYHFPTVPGHEFSGKVILDSSGEYLGKRVAVFPLIPCMECDTCKEEKYVHCEHYNYYGSRCDGGFSEYIAVNRFNLIEIPENVTYEEAAMCEPTSVALCAVRKLSLKGGENLLITGAGPIGLIAGMWAKKFGAEKVSYIDIDSQKIAFAKELGMDEYNGESVDCVLEGTGASGALSSAISAIKPYGKIVLMGNPASEVTLAAKDYQKILRKELFIFGTWNSAYGNNTNDWRDSLSAISNNEIVIRNLITHRISLAEVVPMLEKMRDRKETYCKVMIKNEE